MERPPLLLLTGTLCDARLWDDVVRRLERDHRVEVPGSGPGISTCKEEAERLLAQLSSPVELVGFSLGGLVALEMVAQRPDLVARIALVSAGAGVDTAEGAQARLRQVTFAREHGIARLVREELGPLYAAGPSDVGGVLRPTLVSMATSVGLETFERQTTIALTRADSRARLHHIDVPVLLVSGEQDRLCPPSRHLEMARELRHAKIVCLPACGHFLPLERPAELAAALMDAPAC